MFNFLHFLNFFTVDEEQLLTQQEQEHQMWVTKYFKPFFKSLTYLKYLKLFFFAIESYKPITQCWCTE